MFGHTKTNGHHSMSITTTVQSRFMKIKQSVL